MAQIRRGDWRLWQHGENCEPTPSDQLAERVAFQQAIEEVYWRHRIWPTENPDPKPVARCGDVSSAT